MSAEIINPDFYHQMNTLMKDNVEHLEINRKPLRPTSYKELRLVIESLIESFDTHTVCATQTRATGTSFWLNVGIVRLNQTT